MVLTDGDDIRAGKIDEELLIFDVSDDELERAAPIHYRWGSLLGNAEPAIIGNCDCPV
jgi:hypothetical protein